MGTKVTSMEYWVPVESSDVNDNATQLTIQETIGNRFATALDYGTRFFEIPMSGAPRASSFPRVLSGFLGNPATTGGGPYVHTFDPTAAGKIPEPHSIFAIRNDPKAQGQPAIVDLFWDARGNELQVNIAANDYVKMDANWIALDLDDTQAAPVASYDSSNRFKFSQVAVEWTLDGTFTDQDPILAASAGVTYQNNLDTDEAVLGSRKLYALPYGNADAEVRFSARSEMETFYRYALDADPTDIGFRLTATGTTPDVLVITVPACQEVSAPAPVSGADVLKAIDVTARVHLATSGPDSGKFFTVAVTNGVSSYTAGLTS
jgi:hypothetical protein